MKILWEMAEPGKHNETYDQWDLGNLFNRSLLENV